MPEVVTSTAQIQCSFGLAPAVLNAAPGTTVNGVSMPVATIQAFTPTTCIPPFGMCTSLSNPQVAAATSAALGVLTPMPCVPATAAPWDALAPTVTVMGQPVLVKGATCKCSYGGVIQILSTPAMTVKAGG